VTIQQIQQYIKYKIERIHIHKLKHTYAKFNLHWYMVHKQQKLTQKGALVNSTIEYSEDRQSLVI